MKGRRTASVHFGEKMVSGLEAFVGIISFIEELDLELDDSGDKKKEETLSSSGAALGTEPAVTTATDGDITNSSPSSAEASDGKEGVTVDKPSSFMPEQPTSLEMVHLDVVIKEEKNSLMDPVDAIDAVGLVSAAGTTEKSNNERVDV